MFREIASFIAAQPVFAGMVGAMLTGSALFALRQIPAKIAVLVREYLTVTLTIDSSDDVYDHVSVWLARSKKAKRTHRLMLQEGYDYDLGRWGWEFTLGAGWHMLMYRGRLFLVHRHIPAAEALDKLIGSGRRHRLTITSVGRSQAGIRQLVQEARAAYNGHGRVQVFFYNQCHFMMADKRPARSLDTVYLPGEQKRRLVDRLTTFLDARAEYQRRGIPWRLGVLLEGPPGTGKTTLIFVMAGLLDRSVYVINLNNIAGDNELMAAFNMVGPDAIIALEDVDTCRVTADRGAVIQAPAVVVPGMPAVAEQKGVTLSGLLNAIDGIAAREGRILFMTSNHAEKLDPALVRAGRVDLRETIGLLDREDAWGMFQAFQPDGRQDEFEQLVAGLLPISAAALQNLLLAPVAVANDDHPSVAAAS